MKPGFSYQKNTLCADGIPLGDLAADFGTPLYVYSGGLLRSNFRRFASAFKGVDAMVAYSVKSNSNLGVLRLLAEEGTGFDIVSGGELERVKKAGIGGERVIFAGVGKTEDEMRAALKARVAEFNLESEMEAERLNAVAGVMKRRAPVAIRVNPNVDAKTHKYITTGKSENKFGISMSRALALARRIVGELRNLDLVGLHCHIGSQILDPSVLPPVAGIIRDFAAQVMSETGVKLKTLNFGGGYGIAYRSDQKSLDLKPFADAVKPVVKELGVQLLLEPGRSIAGPAGILLSKVEYIKQGDAKTFVIIDAAMTELMRPTLYQAWHEVRPVQRRRGATRKVDLVGPVCETGDFLAQDRECVLPRPGELLAIMDAGAYGFVMSSNYNMRPRPAEILTENGEAKVVRKRETYADLMRHEIGLG